MRGTNTHWIVVLAILSAMLASCAVNSSPNPTPQRVDSLVHGWFDALEAETRASRSLNGFMAEPPFELSLLDRNIKSLAELETWRADLHARHLELEYEIGPVKVESAGKALHRVRFEFERRSLDDEGIPHIARRRHTWLVRVVPGHDAVILRIVEHPLLAFRGSGSQLVCF